MLSFLRRVLRKAPPATPAPLDGAIPSAELESLRRRVAHLEDMELERALSHAERVSKIDSLIKRLDVRARRAEKLPEPSDSESPLSLRRRVRGT